MRITDAWKDYELLDCSDGDRLERWGDIILIRPDPQVIWKTEKKNPLWKKADAIYHRSQTGGGQWEIRNKIPDFWTIGYRDLTFNIKTMGFKHTGLFPEQAVNWSLASKLIEEENDDIFNPEFLISTSDRTHKAIHYSDESLLPQTPIKRRPGDTCPWRK